MEIFQSLTVPLFAVGGVVSLLLVGWVVASRYKTVQPDSIGVFYGRKYKVKTADGIAERGFKILYAGGKILVPVVERFKVMSTKAFQIGIAETNVPTMKNVGVNIQGVATCKISLDDKLTINAVSAFLNRTDPERDRFVSEILKGHIRTIVAKMDIDELLRQRDTFNKRVVEESMEELGRVGIEVVTLVIQEIRDDHGYIEALGRQAIAETLRNANIKVAEAERDTRVAVSQATREAAEAEANNNSLISDADKGLRLRQAGNIAEVAAADAKAAAAGTIAQVEQEQLIVVLQAQKEEKATEARIAVSQQEAKRRDQELQATVVVEARATADASVIAAEGEKKAAALNAERIRIQAEAERDRQIAEGKGRAESELAVKMAEAEANAARIAKELNAQAEGRRNNLTAEADGKRAGLMAEAEGTDALAKALQNLSEQGKLIIILDRLPKLLEQGGDAAAKVMSAIFSEVAKPMSEIGNISIVDVGGNGDGLNKIAGMVPNTVFQFLAAAKAQGIDLSGLLELAKIKLTGPLAEAVSTADSGSKKSKQ